MNYTIISKLKVLITFTILSAFVLLHHNDAVTRVSIVPIETTTQRVVFAKETTTIPPTTETTIPETTEPETETAVYKPVKVLPKIETNLTEEEIQQNDPEVKKEETNSTPVTFSTATLYENPGVAYGIDISYHQGKIDWAAVKQSGITFAIIRLGFRGYESGSLNLDNCYEYNIKEALANGIQVGVYFFSQAITEQEAIEEASMVLQYIKNYKITYPVVFDWEEADDYRVTTAGITAEKLIPITKAFCETIKNSGYQPMFYGNPNSLMGKYVAPSLNSKYKFWLAHYTDGGLSTPSDYNGIYQMWQYTSSGVVNGITTRVDLNVSYFNYSGTEASTIPIKLNVSNQTITVSKDTSTDLMSGVTASDTVGRDITSKISLVITNSSSHEVSSQEAFQEAGTYTLTFSVTDFTGGSKTETATLIVRNLPVITLVKNVIHAPDSISPVVLQELLLAGVTAYDNEGKDISSDITVNGYDHTTVNTSYTVTYKVTDSYQATSSIEATLVISNLPYLTCKNDERLFSQNTGDSVNLLDYITAYDSYGTILDATHIEVAISSSDDTSITISDPTAFIFTETGNYKLIYTITDDTGNTYTTPLEEAVCITVPM